MLELFCWEVHDICNLLEEVGDLGVFPCGDLEGEVSGVYDKACGLLLEGW